MSNSVKDVSVIKDTKNLKEETKKGKSFLFKDIEINAIKEALLKEIDMTKLKESLVDDIKATLLKEIDVSGIKETLTKDIALKSSVSSGKNKDTTSTAVEDNTKQEQEASAHKKVDLPAYRYGFTETLIKEHQELLSIYGNILDNAKDKEYTTMPMMLSEFSKKCFTHFNEEEELYSYMKGLASNRSAIEKKVATEFSMEMKNLSVSLFSTLNQSNYIPVTDNTVNGFINEFEQIGEILQERISREEKILYPLYENSRKVVDIC